MKCQSLLYEKSKKNISIYPLLKMLPRVLKVKHLYLFYYCTVCSLKLLLNCIFKMFFFSFLLYVSVIYHRLYQRVN